MRMTRNPMDHKHTRDKVTPRFIPVVHVLAGTLVHVVPPKLGSLAAMPERLTHKG